MTTNNNEEQEKISLDGEIKKESGGYEINVQENIPALRKDRFLPISIIVAAVLICCAILFSVFYRGGSSNAGAGKAVNPAAQNATSTSLASLASLGSRDAVLGNQNAPVTVIEYGDYQCPFCTRYFSQIQPLIKSQYIDTGKVKMVFRDFSFLGSESDAAANAAQCANDQGKLWAYHDALYSAKVTDESKNASAENDGFFTRAEFLTLANQVGLNAQDFTSCLDGDQHASDVGAEKAAAVSAGIGSTPTTIVDGKLAAESDGSSAGADTATILQDIAAAVNGQ
jgi:protein-disulfide isomerase